MPNDNEGNDESPRAQAVGGAHHQGRHGRTQRRQGNRGVEHQRGRQPKFEGREPRHQGHIYDWTGREAPNGISGLHVRSARTWAWPIRNTLRTLLQPWTPLNLQTQRSLRHRTKPTWWPLSGGNTCIRNT